MIEAYEHKKHAFVLQAWLTHWGITIPPVELFSDIGFIVNDVAIGFLFTTNSGTAYIDHVCADPRASEMARDSALDDLLNHLGTVSQSMGYKFLTIITRIQALKDRLSYLGFVPEKEYMLYYKILGGSPCHG